MSHLYSKMKSLLEAKDDNYVQGMYHNDDRQDLSNENWWEHPDIVARLPIGNKDPASLNKYTGNTLPDNPIFKSDPALHPGDFFRPYEQGHPNFGKHHSPAHVLMGHPDIKPEDSAKLVDFAHSAYYDPALARTFGTSKREAGEALDNHIQKITNYRKNLSAPEVRNTLNLPVQQRDAINMFYRNINKLGGEHKHFLDNKRPTAPNSTTTASSMLYHQNPPSDIAQLQPKTISHIINKAEDPEDIAPILFHHPNLTNKHIRQALNREDIDPDNTYNSKNWPRIVSRNQNIKTNQLQMILNHIGKLSDANGDVVPNKELIFELNRHTNGKTPEIANSIYNIDPDEGIHNKALSPELVNHYMDNHFDFKNGDLDAKTYAILHPNLSEKHINDLLQQGTQDPEILDVLSQRITNPEYIDNKLFDMAQESGGRSGPKSARTIIKNISDNMELHIPRLSIVKKLFNDNYPLSEFGDQSLINILDVPNLPKKYIKTIFDHLQRNNRRDTKYSNSYINDLYKNAPEE